MKQRRPTDRQRLNYVKRFTRFNPFVIPMGVDPRVEIDKGIAIVRKWKAEARKKAKAVAAIFAAILFTAGCASNKPQPVSVSPEMPPSPLAAIMPPVNHVALARTMVASTIVVPPKPATVTLSADVTNRVTVESSTDLKTWTILTNGFLPMTFPASQLCQYFRLASNTVALAWDASPSFPVAGYKIYQGRESHEYTKAYDVGNVLTCRVPVFIGLNTFAATCYDIEGSESDFSNEAAWTNKPAILNITRN